VSIRFADSSMSQGPQPVTREAFLKTPGKTVERGDYLQTDSPTLSSSRTRWSQLSEWTTFSTDFRTFWDSLPSHEKNENLFTVENLRFYNDTVLANLPRPTNEDMLSQHLDSRYAQPHNWTKTQSHAEIIRRDDGYALIGKPDYLFVAHNATFRALYAVMEPKTFWKVSTHNLMEVLCGNVPFILIC
jgi:hypothetical protein